MKKIIVRLVIALVVLLVLAAVAVQLFLDGAIKRGVETFGPELTKVQVKLEYVNLFLLTGSGKIRGLLVGNPEGYKTPSAIQVGVGRVALRPASLLSDKIVVESIRLQGPEITFETDLTQNNLGKILANLNESTASGKEPTQTKEGKPTKKLEVDDFLITGGKIHVNVTSLGGKSATVALPEIHLKDLGKDAQGITPAELSKKVLQAIETAAAQAAAGAIADLSKGAVYLSGDAAKGATNTVNKVTTGIGDLFKKKK